MLHLERVKTSLALGAVISACFLAGCTTQGAGGLTDGVKTSSIGKISSTRTSYAYSAKDKECLARAMFFESNRSSRDGLVAVGTVVMNRLRSGEYGNTVCAVVGQKGQFAPGVLSRKMNSAALPDVTAAADAVLKGERHPAVKNAMFFHTAGLRFPYKNMHYVLQAGGNAFYEKRSRRHRLQRSNQDTQVAEAAASQEKTAEIPQKAVAAERPRQRSVSSRDMAFATQIRSAATGRSAGTVAVEEPATVAAAEEMTVTLPENGIPLPQKRASIPSAGAGLVQQASATTADLVGQSTLSYEADPKVADAIGALIAAQARPMRQ